MKYIPNSLPWHFMVGMLLALAGWMAYQNSFDGPFVFDDIPNIEKNTGIQVTSLNWDSLWAAARNSPLSSRPIAYVTFAINYWHGGLDVRGYHVVNLGLHVITALVVYWLAYRLFQKASDLKAKTEDIGEGSSDPWPLRFGAFLAASLFLLHPIQTQSVTYVVQRMNVLASLFYLVALACYVEGRLTNSTPKRMTWWFAIGLSWVVALLSKQNAITLPIAVLMVDWYFFRDLRVRLSRGVLFSMMGAGFLFSLAALFYALLVPNLFSAYSTRDFTMIERLMTQTRVLGIYAGLVLWPAASRFNLLHHVDTSTGLLHPPTTLLATVGLITFVVVAMALAKRTRMASFCMLWVLVHLALESTIIPLEMIYEHRMYLPMYGLCAWVGWQSIPLFRSDFRLGVGVIGLLLLAVLGWQTYLRNEIWRDPLTLWNDVIRKNAHSSRAHINRAGLYSELGRWPLAVLDYDQAIELEPDYIMSHYGRGLAKLNLGDPEGAIEDLTKSIQMVGMNDIKASAFRNRGAAYSMLGNKSQAINDYVVSIRLDPTNSSSVYNLANILREQGRFPEAIVRYRECIQIDSRNGRAHLNLALLLTICPDISQRDLPAALLHARRALEFMGEGSAEALETMARVSWGNGMRAEAVDWQRRAIEAAPHASRGLMGRTLDYYRKESASRPKP